MPRQCLLHSLQKTLMETCLPLVAMPPKKSNKYVPVPVLSLAPIRPTFRPVTVNAFEESAPFPNA